MMLVSRDNARVRKVRAVLLPFPRLQKRRKRQQQRPMHRFFWPAMLPLIMMSSILVNWLFLAQLVYAAPLAPTAQSGHLTFQQYSQEGQQSTASHGTFVRPPEEKPQKTPVQATFLPGAEPATMRPMTQALSDTQTNAPLVHASGRKPLDLLSSDGRFEVLVPAGAFDLSKALTSQGTVPGGTLTLRISQVQGHSVGLVNLLGAYQIQVLDSQSKPLTQVALRVPLTIIYHYQPWEMQALDLNPDQIVLSWPRLRRAPDQDLDRLGYRALYQPCHHAHADSPDHGDGYQSQPECGERTH